MGDNFDGFYGDDQAEQAWLDQQNAEGLDRKIMRSLNECWSQLQRLIIQHGGDAKVKTVVDLQKAVQ